MDKDTLSLWAWRLALGTGIAVGILSWLTGVDFLQSVIRMILSFLLMYGLSYGSLYGFEKTALPSEEIQENRPGDGEAGEGRGALIDVAVGQEEMEQDSDSPEDESETKESGSPLAGQVDAHLSEGMPDTDKQAEMVRRMGWGE